MISLFHTDMYVGALCAIRCLVDGDGPADERLYRKKRLIEPFAISPCAARKPDLVTDKTAHVGVARGPGKS